MITIRVAPLISKIFILFMLIILFVPSRLDRALISWNTLTFKDIILMITFLLMSYLFFKKTPSTKASSQSIMIFNLIVFYSFISTLWSNYTGSYWFISYQLILTFLTISIPFLASKITNDIHVDYHKLISNFALIVTVSLAYNIYILSANNWDGRLSGAVGSAAILSVIIIPTIAVHLYNLLTRQRVVVSLVGFFITLLAIFLTESRAGIIMLLLFLVIIFIRKLSIGRIIIIVGLLSTFLFLFGDKISTDRYEMGLDDFSREVMLKTSLSWWLSSPGNFIFGNGYGSIWQWAEYQSVPNFSNINRWKMTEQGYVMYHAHSIFNQLVTETGVIGLILFLIIIYIILRETVTSIRQKNELKVIILLSLIATLPTFITDLMIFRNWGVSVIWLFYYFSIIRYIPDLNKKRIDRNRIVSTT